jgi:prevent-host-death family protein
MKTVAVSVFKQTCLRLIDEVRETGRPIIVTKRGRPAVRLVPVGPKRAGAWLGSRRTTGRILGDLVAPATDVRDWETLRG